MSSFEGCQDLATVQQESVFSWTQRIFLKILQSGPLPKHVAFIMDGNRRYAGKRGLPKLLGHLEGYEKMTEALEWCLELGIKEVTVYAFSIENFKRTEREVQSLMGLFQEKFQNILDEREKFMKNGVCIRVIGNLSLLPPALRKLAAQVMICLKDNNKAVLNIALAYTARDEIVNAVKLAVSACANGKLSTSDITQDLLQNIFYSRKSATPDILIRTSGEVRLSDFLLWQISCTCICFSSALWPEYSAWHFMGALFYYQRSHCAMEHANQLENRANMFSSANNGNEKVRSFIQLVNENFQTNLSECAAEEVV